MKSAAVTLILSACASIVPPYFAAAQFAQSGYSLPLALAVEAATTTIDARAAKGWPASAFVVDTSGVVRVHLKGDHSTIHTKDSAFRKAYRCDNGADFRFRPDKRFCRDSQQKSGRC